MLEIDLDHRRGRGIDADAKAFDLVHDALGHQLDVLGLVAAGKTTAGIAAGLEMSAATVRTHVEHIRTKLGVATRAAMVAEAFRLGMLE